MSPSESHQFESQICKDFYNTHIQCSPARRLAMCKLTLKQSSSKIWTKQRSLRVTASKAHKIWRAKKDSTRIKYFQESGQDLDVAALKYGKAMEPLACKKFTEETGMDVVHLGMVVLKDQSWFSASPDGLYLDANGNIELLEVKCPFRYKNSKIGPLKIEEHTSELQSHHDLVCRLLLEKKNNNNNQKINPDPTTDY